MVPRPRTGALTFDGKILGVALLGQRQHRNVYNLKKYVDYKNHKLQHRVFMYFL